MEENLNRETIRNLKQKMCNYKNFHNGSQLTCIVIILVCDLCIIFSPSFFNYLIVEIFSFGLLALEYIIYHFVVEKALKNKLSWTEYMVFIPINFAEVQLRNDHPLYILLNKNLKKILIEQDLDYDLILVQYFFKDEEEPHTVHMTFEKAKEIFNFS